MAFNQFHRDFTIQRKGAGNGRVPGAYIDSGTGRGYLQPQTSNDANIKQAYGDIDTFTLFTNPDVSLLQEDRVIYGGENYVVLSVQGSGGVSGLGHHKEYICGRVTNG